MSLIAEKTTPFKLCGRENNQEKTVIEFGKTSIGGNELAIMAGPCAVESEAQLLEIAGYLKKTGVSILRGGAYKPRTSPYSFQGLEREGLQLLNRIRKATGLLVVTEVLDQHTISEVAENCDILQVGSRNMQNYSLLRELGRLKKPVLLKRGMSATIEEWLMAAEYIMSGGNNEVILCERGIRTFETYTRNTLDLSAVPLLKELSHLPVIVDPSHATGKYSLVPAMCKAAIMAGADGLIVEVHPCPSEALSDGAQSLLPCKFSNLVRELRDVAALAGKTI